MTHFKINNPTYQKLMDFLDDKEVKTIAHNTIVRLSPEDKNELYVEYHNYIIAVLTKHSIMLNSCGWYTSTTKIRLNWILSNVPLYVYQERFVWYVYNPENKSKIPFKDRMIFNV